MYSLLTHPSRTVWCPQAAAAGLPLCRSQTRLGDFISTKGATASRMLRSHRPLQARVYNSALDALPWAPHRHTLHLSWVKLRSGGVRAPQSCDREISPCFRLREGSWRLRQVLLRRERREGREDEETEEALRKRRGKAVY